MVRALLAGRKRETRRVLRPAKDVTIRDFDFGVGEPHDVGNCGRLPIDKIAPPKFEAGSLIWVRETLRYDWAAKHWEYDADKAPLLDVKGRQILETPRPYRWPLGVCSSMFMPRRASRLTLVVNAVRVERLNDMGEKSAVAEGFEPTTVDTGGNIWYYDALFHFKEYWGKLHGDTAWAQNPWVAVISFETRKGNIDEVTA